MKTITDSVRAIIEDDEVAREAARRGILNSSAYSREIVSQIEDLTMKDVEETSVTVAINRVAQEKNWEPMKPELIFDKISVETGLVDVTYERTVEIRNRLDEILHKLRKQFPHDLFIETIGQSQITMIMNTQMWLALKNELPMQPIGLYENQVAISLSFDERYLAIPNFFYGILGLFALDNINVIEIFSTMTEVTIVIGNEDLDVALSRVKRFMR